MNFYHWLQQLFHHKQQPYQHLRKFKTFHPTLEVFEDRIAPAVSINPANLTVNNLDFHGETIVIDEAGRNNNDIPTVNGSRTLVISAPDGWEFNAASNFSVSHRRGEDITSASIKATSTSLTITIGSNDCSPDNDDDRLRINFQVRATGVGVSNGNLFRTGGDLGGIAGLTNCTSLGFLQLAAGVTVAPAPDGTNLIDTDSANLTNHAIGDIVITEAASNTNGFNGVDNGTRTVVFAAPDGWAFNTSVLPTILRAQTPWGKGDFNNHDNTLTPPSVAFLDATHVQVTFHFDANADNEPDRVTIRGLQVHALSKDAAPGNITRSGGDLVIFKVINGVTNFGSLSLNPIKDVTVTPASLVVNDLQFHDIGDIKLDEVDEPNGVHGFNFTSAGSKTLILDAPTGWVFDADTAPVLTITSTENAGNNDFRSLAAPPAYSVAITNGGTSITITVDFDANPETETDHLVISGVRAKATSGTSDPGIILRNSASTLSIDSVDGATVFGTLERAPSYVAEVKVLSGGHQCITVDHQFNNDLSVEVRDQFGVLIADDTEVTFTAPSSSASGTFEQGCNVTSITVKTVNGIACVPFWANTIAGQFNVAVCVNGVEATICRLDNTPDVAANLDVEAGNKQATTVAHLFSNDLSVKVTDHWGNTVANGTEVTFTAPSAGASGTFEQGCNVTSITVKTVDGIATVPFWANTIAGKFDVAVCVNGVEATICRLDNTPDVAANLDVEAGNKQATTVAHQFSNDLSVKVTDHWGNTVANGTEVTFTVPSAGASGTFEQGCNVTSITVKTVDGIATVPFWANTIAGKFDVAVCVNGVEATICQLDNTPDVAANVDVEAGNKQATTVAHLFSNDLSVKVTDHWGNTVANGTEVNFTAPSSGASGTFEQGCNVTSITVKTVDGIATVPFWANTIAGKFDVAVCVNGVEATICQLDNTPDVAANVDVEAGYKQATTVAHLFSNDLSVKVTDHWGNTVANGTEVNFTAPSSGASGTFEQGCNVTSITVKTVDGIATVPFWANTIAGQFNVAVCVNGIEATICHLDNSPDVPANLEVEGGAHQSVTVDHKFDDELKVKVTDKWDNRVEDGTEVTFTAPSAAASGTFEQGCNVTSITVKTVNGIATVPFWANTIAGQFNLKFSVNGIEATICHLENKADVAARLAFLSQPSSSVYVGTRVGTISVQLQDQYGNAVHEAGQLVTITIPTLPGVVFTAYTDASGKATFTCIAVNRANNPHHPGYELKASTEDLGDAFSDPFVVKAKPARLFRR